MEEFPMDLNGATVSGVSNSLLAGLGTLIMIIGLISLVVGIMAIVGQWKTLKKGNKPGWGAIIPIYTTYLFCDMTGVNPWWILIVLLSPILSIIPVLGYPASLAASIYFSILLNVSIARSFGKSDAYAIGLILLPPIFYLMLGFDSSEYKGKNPMKNIIFKNGENNQQYTNNVNNSSNVQNYNNTINNNVQQPNQNAQNISNNPTNDVNTQNNSNGF